MLDDPPTYAACTAAVESLASQALAEDLPRRLLEMAREHEVLTASETACLADLDALFPAEAQARQVRIPAFAADVHGVEELIQVASYLCPDAKASLKGRAVPRSAAS